MSNHSAINENDLLPLPKGWVQSFSKRFSKKYYYHEETKCSVWVHPALLQGNCTVDNKPSSKGKKHSSRNKKSRKSDRRRTRSIGENSSHSKSLSRERHINNSPKGISAIRKRKISSSKSSDEPFPDMHSHTSPSRTRRNSTRSPEEEFFSGEDRLYKPDSPPQTKRRGRFSKRLPRLGKYQGSPSPKKESFLSKRSAEELLFEAQRIHNYETRKFLKDEPDSDDEKIEPKIETVSTKTTKLKPLAPLSKHSFIPTHKRHLSESDVDFHELDEPQIEQRRKSDEPKELRRKSVDLNQEISFVDNIDSSTEDVEDVFHIGIKDKSNSSPDLSPSAIDTCNGEMLYTDSHEVSKIAQEENHNLGNLLLTTVMDNGYDVTSSNPLQSLENSSANNTPLKDVDLKKSGSSVNGSLNNISSTVVHSGNLKGLKPLKPFLAKHLCNEKPGIGSILPPKIQETNSVSTNFCENLMVPIAKETTIPSPSERPSCLSTRFQNLDNNISVALRVSNKIQDDLNLRCSLTQKNHQKVLDPISVTNNSQSTENLTPLSILAPNNTKKLKDVILSPKTLQNQTHSLRELIARTYPVTVGSVGHVAGFHKIENKTSLSSFKSSVFKTLKPLKPISMNNNNNIGIKEKISPLSILAPKK